MSPDPEPSGPPAVSRIPPAAAVFVLGLLMFSWGLGAAPLAGTEGHRALTGHEIAQRGNWLLPSLYGELYLRKPPLHYWILAAVERATGKANEWTWRLPSAFAAAATAALMAWVGRRRFGRRAGWVSGLACLALVAIWSQSRNADLDAVHTLAVSLAAVGLLDLQRDGGRSRVAFAMAALGLGAALLTKGPAGLPVVIGALVGAPLLGRSWRRLRRPRLGLALAVGVALFAAWALAAKRAIDASGVAPDLRGLQELSQRFLGPRSADDLVRALALPAVLFLYALPVSAALPLVLARRGRLSDDERRDARALAGTVLVALAVFMVSGAGNPRYGYVALPLLAPLAGAAFRAFAPADGGEGARFRRALLVASAALLALGVAFSFVHRRDREKRSAFRAAQVVRAEIGETKAVYAGAMVLNQPELFYYAGVDVRRTAGPLTSCFRSVRGWAVLARDEWNALPEAERAGVRSATELPMRARGTRLIRK